MEILVISDKPDSAVLSRCEVDTSSALPFPKTPFSPEYLDENTDPPEEIKLLKHRLARADSVLIHVEPGQHLTELIAWGRLKGSNWSGLNSATVIREDGNTDAEDEMNSRLSEVLDEDAPVSDEEIVSIPSMREAVKRLGPSYVVTD